MIEIGKALVELDEVLNRVPKKDLEKIPEDIRQSIKENKDKNYNWKYDDSKSLKEQSISEEAMQMLAYLNTEYMLDSKQRELMNKIFELNQAKLEIERKQKYKTYKGFNNSNS